MPFDRLLLLLLLCGALGACSRFPTRIVRGAEAAHAPKLQRVDSTKQLQRLLEAGEHFHEEARSYRVARLCAEAAYAGQWFCRPDDDRSDLERIEVTGSRIEAPDLITNTQEAGVDEGDLVKKLGDRLIVLRQGTLHVVGLTTHGRPDLQLLDSLPVAIDAEGRDTWYDEIIAAGGRIVLLGFNPRRAYAELSVFDLGEDGRLARRARHWVQTQDYFDDSNYGARFVGEELLLTFSLDLESALERWPEARRRDLPHAPAYALLMAEDVHLPLEVSADPTLHVILRCPIDGLDQAQLHCRRTAIVGSGSKQFYATTRAAYLALTEEPWRSTLEPRREVKDDLEESVRQSLEAANYTLVYRLPFDGGPLAVARVEGAAHAAQFGFLETEEAFFMVTERYFGGESLLQRLALADFGPRPTAHAAQLATFAPTRGEHRLDRVSRFAHDALWLADTRSDDEGVPIEAVVVRQPLDGGAPVRWQAPHSLLRLDPFGDAMLLSGITQQDLQAFSVLDGRDAGSGPRASMTLPGHYVSEDRSHAFNATRSGSAWTFGLPTLPREIVDDEDLWPLPPSDLAYFAYDAAGLRLLGITDMPDAVVDCAASACEEWYGNARLFFVEQRSFALSGDWLRELVFSPAGVVTRRELSFK